MSSFPLLKAAFPTYSPRNSHFLISVHIKSEEILWRGETEGRGQSIPARAGAELGLCWSSVPGRPAVRGGRKEAQLPLIKFLLCLPPG